MALLLDFNLSLTSFKHVGIFPEQAVHWDYIYEKLTAFKAQRNLSFLNLFAYTGGASLAAKAAGADVTHLDSIRQVVSWARQNMELSKLDNIRWLMEDAMKFVRREIKRGSKYQGIILTLLLMVMDRIKNNGSWKTILMKWFTVVLQILDDEKHMLILNTYSLGFSSLIIENLLAKRNKELKYGEFYLQATYRL